MEKFQNLLNLIFKKHAVPDEVIEMVSKGTISDQKNFAKKLLKSSSWEDAMIQYIEPESYGGGMDTGGKIVTEPTLDHFEKYGHIAIMGPTESGKTSLIKTFFCDNKFKDFFNQFIYVGPPKQLEEMALAYAAHEHLNNKDYKKGDMQYFKLEEIDKALIYAQTENSNIEKLLFIDDALIIHEQFNKKIATFIHQAKNYNVTMIVAMHEPFGNSSEKMIRSGCRYYVTINLSTDNLTRLLKIPGDHIMLKQIENHQDPHSKVIIFDKVTNNYYNSKYTTFNSV